MDAYGITLLVILYISAGKYHACTCIVHFSHTLLLHFAMHDYILKIVEMLKILRTKISQKEQYILLYIYDH